MARPSPVPPAVPGAGAVEAGEALEDPLPLVRRHARAVVLHDQRDARRPRTPARRSTRPAACRAAFSSRLRTSRRELVRGCRAPARPRPARCRSPVRRRPHPGHLLQDHVVEVDGRRRRRGATLVGAGQEQQVADQPLHPLGCPPSRSPASRRPVGRPGWARATSSWVRNAASGLCSSCEASATKRALALDGRLQPVEHGVHRAGQPADLVVAGRHRHPAVEVARGDRRPPRPGSPPPGAAPGPRPATQVERRAAPASSGTPTASSRAQRGDRLRHRLECWCRRRPSPGPSAPDRSRPQTR